MLLLLARSGEYDGLVLSSFFSSLAGEVRYPKNVAAVVVVVPCVTALCACGSRAAERRITGARSVSIVYFLCIQYLHARQHTLFEQRALIPLSYLPLQQHEPR